MFFKELVLIMEGVFCMCKFTTQLKAAFHPVGLCYVERLSRMLIYWKDQKSNRWNVVSAESSSHAYWSLLTVTECCICGHLVCRGEWPASLGCTCSPDEIGQQPLPLPGCFPCCSFCSDSQAGTWGVEDHSTAPTALLYSRNRLLGSKDSCV